MIKVIGIVLFIIFILAISTMFIIWLCWRFKYRERYKHFIRLSLREYLRLKNINPEKWEWGKSDYLMDLKRIYYNRDYCSSPIRVDLSFIGYIVALILRFLDINNYKSIQRNETKRIFLEDVQADVNELMAKAEKEIRQAEKITIEIGRRATK